MFSWRSPQTRARRRSSRSGESRVIAAFAYLIANTTRNRLQSQLKRLRTPRYAIGFALGLLYFWGVFGRHFVNAPRTPVAVAGAGSPLEALAPFLLAVVMAGIWIFGGDMSALAFSEAEVHMLLTAPVSRRALILYKLVRSQLLILINVAIWVFLLRRGNRDVPAILSAAAVWVIFTTLNLHRMGEALTRASRVEYKTAGRQKKFLLKTIAVMFVMVFVMLLVLDPLRAVGRPNAAAPFAFLHDITVFFQSPRIRTVLYPFHLVTAPSFSRSVDSWLAAMLPALGIVLLHVLWVLRSDAAFEEAAAMASAELARRIDAMRSRKSMTLEPVKVKDSGALALASTGTPAIAILWKNVIALRRTIKLSAALRLPLITIILAGFFGWRSGDLPGFIAISAGMLGLLVPIFGLQILRNDLRSDMMNLPLLKSLPLAGGDLVLAEIASSAIPMVLTQLALFAIAAAAFAFSVKPAPFRPAIGIGVLITLPLLLIAIDGAICTIVNGTAVLFPAWVRLGPSGPGGVEMMGQAMLSMIVLLVVFALMLLIPIAAGAAAWYLLSASVVVAVVVACALGSIALAAESYGMILALGSAFERAEPQNVT
jgi:ABC-2 type transport system permease protein